MRISRSLVALTVVAGGVAFFQPSLGTGGTTLPSAYAQTPPVAAPTNQARLLTSLTPGDTSGFPDSTTWTANERANCIVYAQAKDGGPIYVLNKRAAVYGALPWVATLSQNAPRPPGSRADAKVPEPRPTYLGLSPYPERNDLGVVGFEVPQLPLGDYLVWVEEGPASAVAKLPLRIEPALTAVVGEDRLLPDTPFDVLVQIAGPAYAPPIKGSLSAQLQATARTYQALQTLKGALVTARKPTKLTKVSPSGALAQPAGALRLNVGPLSGLSTSPITTTISLAGYGPDIVEVVKPEVPPTTIKAGERLRFAFSTTARTREGTANIRFDAPGFVPAIVRMEKILPPPPPPPPPGKIMPVVFVPGTAGSYLQYADGEPMWLTSSNLGTSSRALSRAGLNPAGDGGVTVLAPKALGSMAVSVGLVDYFASYGGVVQPVMVEDVYAEFLAWADQRFRTREGRKLFYEAPYDWRKAGSLQNAQAIDAVVERARREHGADQVILIAHSLGGIVSRDYLRRLNGREGSLSGGPTKVAQLIAVGTPWLGAPKTARALLWGYNFDVGMAEWPSGTDDSRTLPIATDDDAVFRIVAPTTPNAIRHAERHSLLDLNECKTMAKNWPAVWQQLPTQELHAFYREARAGRVPNWNRVADYTSVYGWTEAEYAAFLSSINPTLRAQTQTWRQSMFGAFDFGVPHFLIAGTVSPASNNVGDWTDMQMARPEHLPPAKRATGFVRYLLGPFMYEVAMDNYFATDSAKHWGDGTSPMLSASAGAFAEASSASPNLARARALLGPNTQVVKLGLQSQWKNGELVHLSHASMLNDTDVRGNLWKQVLNVYREKNAPALGGVDAKVVRKLKIEVRTKANNRPWNDYGTYHIVRAQFRGLVFPLNEAGNGTAFGLGSGETLSIEAEDATIKDERGWWRRPLETDFEGQTLKFSMAGVDDWVCANVRFFADGKQVLNDDRDFRLNGDNSRKTSAMSKP